jgi:hypothetical protein
MGILIVLHRVYQEKYGQHGSKEETTITGESTFK